MHRFPSFRAVADQGRRACVYLMLAVAFVATPVLVQAQALPAIAASRSGMKSLSTAQRQALVLLVAMRIKANSARLPRGDAAATLRSMKVVALENVFMASLSKDAGWSAMQRYYQDSADATTRMIRGELQGAKAVAAAKALEERRRALASQAFARANAAKISPSDVRLNGRADAIASEIAKRARTTARK